MAEENKIADARLVLENLGFAARAAKRPLGVVLAGVAGFEEGGIVG